LHLLEVFFPFLKTVTLKAVWRNKPLDAHARYQTLLVALTEVWGMKYRPLRYDFGFRYGHDFPMEIQSRLEKLCYPSNLEELKANILLIELCFFEAIDDLKT
jgi:hypothetical protein